MGSALLNTPAGDTFPEATAERSAMASQPGADALRTQVAERLAAHRSRRGQAQPAGRDADAVRQAVARPGGARSARIAAAVAERYAHTQSYRAFLAAEAEKAIQQARAAAEVAARNAQAVAAAQQSLLDTFDRDADAQTQEAEHGREQEAVHAEVERASFESQPLVPLPAAGTETREAVAVELNLWPDLEPARPVRTHQPRTHRPAHEPRGSNLPALTVRLYEGADSAAHVNLAGPRPTLNAAHTNRPQERNDAEACVLDEEIAFRQAPVFEEPAGPPVPLPANLIEFPRQLVASRKARPRIAEGPLLAEAGPAPGDGQLRIFEVDPAQISTTPAADIAAGVEGAATAAPQWTSLWLDSPERAQLGANAAGQTSEDASAHTRLDSALQPATIGRRLLAASVNGAILLTALGVFAFVFAGVLNHGLPWQSGSSLRQMAHSLAAQTVVPRNLMAPIAAGVFGLLYLIYVALFFSFSEGTPGMRCARIALCTFDDENPSRKAMRVRMAAILLSACPLGLGFLWATLDEERLAWHDRICRMYQRSY